MEHQIIEIIADQLAIDRSVVTLQSTFKQLGCDSLDTINIVMQIENTLNIKIPDEKLGDIANVGDIVTLVAAL